MTNCLRNAVLLEIGDGSVVQRLTRDRKVSGSSPGRSGGGVSSPGSTFCADFGVRSTPVLPR